MASKRIKVKIKELGKVVGGATPSTRNPENWGGSIPWLTPKDLANHRERFIKKGEKSISQKGYESCSTKMLPKGTVLFSSRAPIGYCAIAENDICTNQGFKSIVPNENTDSLFLYYLLKNNVDVIANNASGTTFLEISGKAMEEIEVVIPEDKNEQRQITQILDAFDRKIENNLKLNDYLTELLLARFNHWLENRNDCWGPFETAEISSLDLYITDYVANGSFASLKENVELLNNQGYAYFMRNTDLKTREFNVYVTEHSYKFLSKSALYGGEVIISNVGDVGSVHRCPSLNKPMTLGNNEIMIKGSIGGQSANNFLYLLFTSRYGQHLIDSVTGGSVQRKFNKTDFKSIKIPIPSTRGLISFNNWVQPIFDILEGNFREIDQIKELRDVLLFKLISKEINNASTD